MRLPNWPSLLADEIERWRAYQFQWGTTDCCQFAGAAQYRITGVDRRSIFGCYESEFGAARILAEYGGMQGLLTAAWGEPKSVAMAGRGDVVMCEFGQGLQPAVVIGVCCVAPSIHGGLAHRRVVGDQAYPDSVMAWGIG